MAKKLENNGLWESSRMMLPEHKERIVEHRHDLNRRTKPEMDEQRQEVILQALSNAVNRELVVTVTVWGDFGDRHISGKITKVNRVTHQIKVENESEYSWVNIGDIVDIQRYKMRTD